MGLHKKDVMMMNLVPLDFKESCADHASNTERMKNQLGCGIFVILIMFNQHPFTPSVEATAQMRY